MSDVRAFDLPPRLAAKAEPALIADDERHFAAIARTLEQSLTDLATQLDAERRKAGGSGQAALDRDLEIHRLSSRLRALGRYRLDLCLGRVVHDHGETTYIGRFGLTDETGERLLVDWRAPAAEPFFAATHADPLGLASRRRYRWSGGRVSDYWDEVFTADGLTSSAALDDQSAFIASLGASRSPQMRDVLSTIQADQDAIVRADSRGPLVVDGGPGTGKTVVALHRAAYLLYSDPRLAAGRGGVLFVGPHQPYLAYVADVLPSLGEEGVQTCTVRDLVPGGAAAPAETDPRVAALKASVDMVRALEPAVQLFEEPPTRTLVVETPWAELVLTPDAWADAFTVADAGVSHNEAREQVWEEILDILVAQHDDDDVPLHVLRRTLARDEGLARTFHRAWPLLEPANVLADLWSVPAFLRRSAPHLAPGDVDLLHRDAGAPLTLADLPLLDVLRQRIGDPDASRRRVRRDAEIAAERERRAQVIDELIAADDSELLLMSMLRGDDAQNSLDDDAALPALDPDLLAGPFAHIVVDEAQELTDAEWGMLLRRCPSRSFTIVGDRAQARHGFAESWAERLARVGLGSIRISTLTVNYRTPEEVMAVAEPVIRAALPDANVPTAVRRSGLPVLRCSRTDAVARVEEWLSAHGEGTACVISDSGSSSGSDFGVSDARVRRLTPETAKGLEFDVVVLADSGADSSGIEGAVDRYVAMTRATQQLILID